jgi:hypothetical protein
MRTTVLAASMLLLGCDNQKIALGGGAPPDARLYADVYTWECEDTSSAGALYPGVFSFEIALEYAPDALADRDLPGSGCSRGLDLFPSDAGAAGLDIPDAARPTWSTAGLEGELGREAEGFYFDSAFDNRSSCAYAEDLLADGTTLADAGVFSGARAPVPGTVGAVTFSGELDAESGIPFGAELTASWDASGWDDAWVQVRREKDGQLVESVTCAAEGDSYTLGDDAWGLLSDALEVDVTNLYVGFQVEGSSTAEDGQKVATYTRAMHVAVVQD